MNDDVLHILLIEDSDTDAYMIRRLMDKGMNYACEVIHVTNMADAEAVLKSKKETDVILLDLGLPDTKGGADTFKRLSAVKEKIPVIVQTCTSDHDLAVSIIGDGAEDYVKKSSFTEDPKVLCDAIEYAVHRHKHLTEIKAGKDKKIKEKDQIIKWITGSYSVME